MICKDGGGPDWWAVLYYMVVAAGTIALGLGVAAWQMGI